jgi:Lrp/AsnC family leucine-responsive transcriptional regulator
LAAESTALDATDRRILRSLVQDGRASFAKLGSDVALSPHAVAERVRKLRRGGVILSFAAQLDYSAIGRGLDAIIDLRLLPTTDPDQFESVVRQMPQICEISFVTGRFDYQLRVACADADDLDRALRAIRTKAGVAITETRIVLRTQLIAPTL